MNNHCHGHNSGHGGNKYKCSAAFCGTGNSYIKWLEKELKNTPHGLDGLYQVNGQWRSEHLDIKEVAPVAHVSRDIAESFGMTGMPNVEVAA